MTKFHVVPSELEPEHVAVCSIDGEPWPCIHARKKSHARYMQRWGVLCAACGKQRNAWSSLAVENADFGRTIYFHARRRCRQKAAQWWAENVQPYTGESFEGGRLIDNLARYLSSRGPLSKVN